MNSERTIKSRHGGFTLIETVVALMVVALGMTAVFMQLNQFASNTIYLRDKTLASWIGSNSVTELSLQPEWPEVGEDQVDDLPFAGRLWSVTIVISETEIQNLHRADVSVALADRPDRIIHTVSGLIEPPAPPSLPPASWLNVRRGPRG